jgi:hypothetical protein
LSESVTGVSGWEYCPKSPNDRNNHPSPLDFVQSVIKTKSGHKIFSRFPLRTSISKHHKFRRHNAMNRIAAQIRTEIPEPPLAHQILEGLSQREVAIVFDLILLLKERRSRGAKSKTAKANPTKVPHSAHGIDDRMWFLIELIQSFMDLYVQDDEQLVEKIGGWFKDLDYSPTVGYFPDGIPVETMDLFEGLDDKVWLSIVRMIAFLRREMANSTFGEDPSRTMVELDEKAKLRPEATASRPRLLRDPLRYRSK